MQATPDLDLDLETRLLREGVRAIPREWFRPQEWIVLAQGMGDLAVLLIGAFLCLAYPSPWVRVPVWVVMAGRIHALGILMHDLVHLTTLNRPAKRLLFDLVICYPILINMDYYGLAHRLHHTEANLPGRDPYFVPLHQQHPIGYLIYVLVGSMLLALVLILRLLIWPFTLVSPGFKRVYVKYLSQLGASPDPEALDRQEMGRAIWIWASGPLIFWAAVALALSATGTWRPFWYAYFIPLLLSTVLGQLRLACDHIYTAALGNSLVEQVAGATSVEAPWWQQLVLGAHGTSYHALHHLVPTLPNYRLAAAHRLVLATGSQVYARTVYPGYGAVLVQLFRAQLAWSRSGRKAPAGAAV